MFDIFSRKKRKEKRKEKSVSEEVRIAPPRPVEEVRSSAPSAAGGVRGVVREFGGPSGVEPTRYGDWERKGRCIDF